jgi:pimeloyl-ACP methyl ester carboxylesterase
VSTKRWTFRYRAHNRTPRPAIVLAPSRYGPDRPSPPLPLVISPHGRGVRPKANADLWGDLPGLGHFVVVCPGGMGRRLPISDLARMPGTMRAGLPWLRVDMDRIYALGGSMGGHETLLLLGQYPKVLAGAVAMDPVTNFYRRYGDFGLAPRTRGLQVLCRFEVGGTPKTNPTAYVLRSPTHWIRETARSGVPLQLWWSLADQIILDQVHQTAHFYTELKKLRPKGRVEAVTGHWNHSAQMRTQIPQALRFLGVLD